jgi:iron complex outermembrane receptor protein
MASMRACCGTVDLRLLSMLRISLTTAALSALLGAAAHAQAPVSSPVSSPAPAASAPAAKLEAVQITGARANDTQERRLSTAAKIVIGRDEIDRFGDSSVGEVLKRLPGVTVQGAPGRGGAIRMRGLGSGYTLILLDGQRVPPGFSIDSLAPEQVERIEVLRAPTAETGARAIAGVINIVTREGFRKRLNNVRLGATFENGRVQPGLSWTRNDTLGDLIYNFSVSLYRQDRDSDSVTTSEATDLATDTTTHTRETHTSREQRVGVNATGRLQWRGENGHSAVLSPIVIYSDGRTRRTGRIEQDLGVAPYDHADSETNGTYSLLRLNGEWRQQLAEAGRIELKGGAGEGHWDGRTLRHESGAVDALVDDRSDTRDFSSTLSAKYTAALGAEHSVVAGAEAERNRRRDERETLRNGMPYLADFGDNLQARSTRLAAYAQDEWTISPQWSAQAGLRWEGVRTHSEGVVTPSGTADITNDSSVWSPLLHAVWKPDPQGRDQLRMSLTRTYRSPTLQNLIARPSTDSRYPVTQPGGNTAAHPDRVGNPELRPELATGLDLAVERYLAASGILSANLFYRRIGDYMRSVTTLRDVPWYGTPRYVARTENVGRAVTQGLELEAKFRLSDVVDGAPKVDLRLNASLFRSRVKNAPGPDNRLDQQPDGTANAGADYRLAGTPLTVGGNLNLTPGYDTRISEAQWAEQGRKLVGDAYVLVQVSPQLQLRLTASNLLPRDYLTGSRYEDAESRELSQTRASTYVNWLLRLEMNL